MNKHGSFSAPGVINVTYRFSTAPCAAHNALKIGKGSRIGNQNGPTQMYQFAGFSRVLSDSLVPRQRQNCAHNPKGRNKNKVRQKTAVPAHFPRLPSPPLATPPGKDPARGGPLSKNRSSPVAWPGARPLGIDNVELDFHTYSLLGDGGRKRCARLPIHTPSLRR